jgi:WD40 repeat protein
MSAVGNPRIEANWAAEQSYRMWKEVPADITCNHVLPLLNPLDHSRCSVVSTQWYQFLTSKPVWPPLARYHFPSLTPGFLKSFQAYQRFYSNLPRGVCSVKTLERYNKRVRSLFHKSQIRALALKDTTLFSGSDERTIKVWDLRASTCRVAPEEHTDGISSLALKDTTLFTGSYDNTIKIWDLRTNTCTATLKEHTGGVYCLALKGAMLFSGSDDKTIKIWDLRDNTCTSTLKGHTNGICSLALKDKMLFSSSYDNTIKIWDLRTNTCTTTLKGHTNAVCGLAFRDATLLSGSYDKTIKIWDLRDNTCTATLKGHTKVVFSLAIRDATLFSGSWDNTIKIWDLGSLTNTCTATLKGHSEGVSSLVLRDATLISGSYDNTIKIWDFAASHVEIFMEIADAFESQDQEEAEFALERFSKMPKAAKNKIFNELYKIIKPKLKRDYWRCAEHAFYEKNEQSATNAQRAEAIENYLKKETG